MGTGKQKYTGIKPASESSIEITFTFQGKRCRERLKVKPTASGLKQAANHRAAIIHAIETGTFDYSQTFPSSSGGKKFRSNLSGSILTEKYLNIWLEARQKEFKSSVRNDYKKMIKNQLIPAFGHIPLQDLKRSHVREWANSLSCSLKRIRNLVSPLRKALEFAANEDEIIESNPLATWSYYKVEPPKDEDHVDPLLKEEQEILLSKLSGQRKNLIQFAFWSGLRTSELIALRWKDIDWIKNEINITKAKTKTATTDEPPKTFAGKRRVKLFSLARIALLDQKQYTFLKGEHIFNNPYDGKPWKSDRQIHHVWSTALKKAGIRYRKPYQTRHTFCSMLLSAGEHPMWVAKQMGHQDWVMIVKTYGRWMPDSNDSAGQKAENLYGVLPEKNRTVITKNS